MPINDKIKQQQFNSKQQKAGMQLIFTANWLNNPVRGGLAAALTVPPAVQRPGAS